MFLLLLIKQSKQLEVVTSPDFKTLRVKSTILGEELYQDNVTACTSKTVLEAVFIEVGIATLGSEVFSNCVKLTSASLPIGMTLIKNSAFIGCSSLKYIVLPEGLRTLQGSVFFQCLNLINVTIPSTLTEISGGYVFYACTHLQKFIVPKKNNVFSTTEDGSVLIRYGNIACFGTCGRKIIRIPDCAQTIESYFLNGVWDSVTGIDFGSAHNLTTIKSASFRQTSISSVIFPEGLKYIKGAPFDQLEFIQLMSFPSTLIEYGNVFQTIPKKVEIAPNCSALKKDERGVIYNHNYSSIVLLPGDLSFFEIPSTVNEVNLAQLRKMRTLMNITAPGHPKYSSYKGVLYSPDQTEMKAVPGGMTSLYVSPLCKSVYAEGSIVSNVIFEGNVVEEISHNGFYLVKTIKSIEIPDSVTTINSYSFGGSGIRTIHFPASLKFVKKSSFGNCPLEEADLRRCVNLTEISDGAFNTCEYLVRISLPPFLDILGDSCFKSCIRVKEICINSSISTIGISCFSGCSALEIIEIKSSRIKEFPIDAFKGCKLETIVVPDSIETISQGTFENNYYLRNVNFGANSGLKTILVGAFKGCKSINVIQIPKTVETISIGALSQMYGLTRIEVDASNNQFRSIEGILFDKNGRILKSFPGGIVNTVIKGSIQRIAEKAFFECILLRELRFENVDLLESFGEYTFSGCSNLSSIHIPSCVREILPFCFSSCVRLTNVSFADGSHVRSISSGVFDQCVSLRSISFGLNSQLGSILDEAFKGCESLEIFDFPIELTQIGVKSFAECKKLQRILLNETKITTIGKDCFKDCSSIIEITLRVSLQNLGSGSFSGCSSLKSIFYCGSEQFSSPAFNGVFSRIEVDVLVDYPHNQFGGLPVNRILDGDCHFPSAMFTPNNGISIQPLFAITGVTSKDE